LKEVVPLMRSWSIYR